MWTWRESNPRPHKETICFLHAYLGLWFWCNSKTRATDCCLSLFGFHMSSEAYSCYFRFILHRLFFGFGKRSSERCLVPSPCDGIKPIVYCASTRQRERNYFRQLKILKSDIKVREQQLTTCLLTPSSRCQSQSAPCVLSLEKNYYALTL